MEGCSSDVKDRRRVGDRLSGARWRQFPVVEIEMARDGRTSVFTTGS